MLPPEIDHDYCDRLEENRQYAYGEYLDSLSPEQYADHLREQGFHKEADELLKEQECTE